MLAGIKHKIATFFYGHVGASKLDRACARARAAEKERDIYKTKSELYALEVRKLTGMLEKEWRNAGPGYDICTTHAASPEAQISAQKKQRDWAKVMLLGNEATVTEHVAIAKRRMATSPQEKRSASALRGKATKAMTKWKEAKKEFDKKYPPCE